MVSKVTTIPYSDAQAHMLKMCREGIHNRVESAATLMREASEECQRLLKNDQTADELLMMAMSRIRNSYNSVMGEMESAVRQLGEMQRITEIVAQDHADKQSGD